MYTYTWKLIAFVWTKNEKVATLKFEKTFVDLTKARAKRVPVGSLDFLLDLYL